MNAQMEKLEAILTEEVRVYGELARTCSEVAEKVRLWELDGLAELTREQNELIMAAAETERVNQAVADGTLEQAAADEWLADLEARVKEVLEQPLRFGGRGASGQP